MYSILSNSGRRVYGVKHYMVETLADIDAIPLLATVAPGSTALVAATQEKYILTKERVWMPLGNSGGSGPSTGDDVIYEGGDIDQDISAVFDIYYDGGNVK